MNSQNGVSHAAALMVEGMLPQDTRQRVEQSYRQWNAKIREHLRSETGLRLVLAGSRSNVPVRVVEGFPGPLARLLAEQQDSVLWLLMLQQQQLRNLVRGAEFLREHWDDVMSWPPLPEHLRTGPEAVEATLEIGRTLLRLVEAENLREQIRTINQDIWGAYFSTGSTRIELYWMAIGMAATMIGQPVEDVTVVVLTHELAHAYTHLGLDTDGQSWSTEAFQRADREIVEGLAQFYTERLVYAMTQAAPGLYHAYEGLLQLQSGPYLVHRDWQGDDGQSIREKVRFALIACRNKEIMRYPQLLQNLKEAHSHLGRGSMFRSNPSW